MIYTDYDSGFIEHICSKASYMCHSDEWIFKNPIKIELSIESRLPYTNMWDDEPDANKAVDPDWPIFLLIANTCYVQDSSKESWTYRFYLNCTSIICDYQFSDTAVYFRRHPTTLQPMITLNNEYAINRWAIDWSNYIINSIEV